MFRAFLQREILQCLGLMITRLQILLSIVFANGFSVLCFHCLLWRTALHIFPLGSYRQRLTRTRSPDGEQIYSDTGLLKQAEHHTRCIKVVMVQKPNQIHTNSISVRRFRKPNQTNPSNQTKPNHSAPSAQMKPKLFSLNPIVYPFIKK
jgi:hypothetical protein